MITCHEEHEHGTAGAAVACDRARQPSGYTLTNAEYHKRKAALTRARNSGDPKKIIATVRAARILFEQQGFPDSWPTWRIAVSDLTFHDDAAIRQAARAEEDAWTL